MIRRPNPPRLAVAALGACLLAGCASAPAPVASSPSRLASAPSASGPATPGATASATPSAAQAPSAPATPAAAPSTAPGCPAPAASFVSVAPGSGKTVALTFDDGPAPADPAILQALASKGVHATFFLTGAHAQASPDTVKAIAAGGHLVADHSWEHQYPSAVAGGWTVDYLTGQFNRTDTLLQSLTGQPVCFFRPPGGHTDNVLQAAGKAGLTSVLWSVDSLDWQQPASTTAAATASIVKQATNAGSRKHPIVLMHSGKASREPDSVVNPNRSNTVAALPAIIDWYQAQGYRFVRLDGRA